MAMLKIKFVSSFLLQALHEVVRAAGLQLLLHHCWSLWCPNDLQQLASSLAFFQQNYHHDFSKLGISLAESQNSTHTSWCNEKL